MENFRLYKKGEILLYSSLLLKKNKLSEIILMEDAMKYKTIALEYAR